MSSNNSNLDDIVAKLKQGKVCLFLGAGVSCHAGLPSGTEISAKLKSHFPKADQLKSDFMEICDDILETTPYTRIELIEFIKEQLSGYQVTEEHFKLTKYDWSAIFTTNFDDIIESAYTQSTIKVKSCQDIYSNTPSISGLSDRNKTYLFKIMGTTRIVEGEGEMVLTTTDFMHSFIKRQTYYHLLKDFLKNGCIVFIGYSFNDKIVKQAIDDIIKFSGGVDKLPYSYALFKDPLPEDEKIQNFFKARRVIPINSDFKTFINYIDTNYEQTNINTKLESVKLNIRGKEVSIPKSDLITYSSNFELLYEEIIRSSKTDIEDYFKGDISKWNSYEKQWDFIRDCYNDDSYFQRYRPSQISIYNSIFSELKKTDSDKNRIILIKGMPGSGKSVLLRRIAYDIYSKNDNPVIILNNKLFNYDKKLITGFIEDIRERYSRLFKEGEIIDTVKFVVIVDDFASKYRDILLLKDFLTSRGRSVLFIAAARSNEMEANKISINPDFEFELPEILTDKEILKIAGHFSKLGFAHFTLPRLQDLIKKEYNGSFFATVYSLVHPSRKPLDEIINNQYLSLSSTAQIAFDYICCFSQFNLPINTELLVRSLGISYMDFIDEILKGEARKIIFQEQDSNDNLFLKAHHPIIAKKTIEFFLKDAKILLEKYIHIFSNANFSINIERELCEKIIIDHLKGRESRDRSHFAYFTNAQLILIFETICKNNSTRSLLHHYALLLQEEKDFKNASDLLEKALEDTKEGEGYFSGESDQNILTSLGSLNSRLGQEELKKGSMADAEKYFSIAEDYYRQAKYSNYSDGHAYHSHAFMYFIRGVKLKELKSKESYKYFSLALEVIATAKDNINEDNLEAIYELQNKVYLEIEDEISSSQIIEILRDQFNSAMGYFIVSSRTYNEGILLKTQELNEEANSKFRLADEKVNKGLKYFPTDENCLSLKAKITKERFPTNYELQFQFLQAWKENTNNPNVKLLYDLGRIAFILEYYDISRNTFDELQKGPGFGNKARSRTANPILNQKTNLPYQYEGKITNIFNLYEGNLQPYSLRNFKNRIAFSPVACKFTPTVGNLVKFNISFSFRGPVAENLVRI